MSNASGNAPSIASGNAPGYAERVERVEQSTNQPHSTSEISNLESDAHVRGPQRNEPANLVALCSARSYFEGNGCHEMVHNRRALLGEPDGWIIPAGQDPAQVPILHHTLGSVWLLVDGGYATTPPEAQS